MPGNAEATPLDGPVQCLEIILCALTVAPPVLLPELEAALRKQMRELRKDGYTDDEMPWPHQHHPDEKYCVWE